MVAGDFSGFIELVSKPFLTLLRPPHWSKIWAYSLAQQLPCRWAGPDMRPFNLAVLAVEHASRLNTAYALGSLLAWNKLIKFAPKTIKAQITHNKKHSSTQLTGHGLQPTLWLYCSTLSIIQIWTVRLLLIPTSPLLSKDQLVLAKLELATLLLQVFLSYLPTSMPPIRPPWILGAHKHWILLVCYRVMWSKY